MASLEVDVDRLPDEEETVVLLQATLDPMMYQCMELLVMLYLSTMELEMTP